MERIGRYVIERPIGSGAFATVHLARDPHLDVPVAIKLLAENHAFEPESRRRFIQEARLLRRANHHNLVRVHDLGEHEGRPFIVMDHAEGGSLADRLDAGHQWNGDPDSLLRIAAELAAGLHAVHLLGVVHRDLKPSNLLIHPERAPVMSLLHDAEHLLLADFGLARSLLSTGITAVGGTPGYMAPEQWNPSASLDERTDLFAATVLIAEVASGLSPSDGDVEARMLIGTQLESFVLRGTAEDPDDRWSSVAEWLAALAAGLGREPPELPGSAARPPSLLEPVVDMVSAPPRTAATEHTPQHRHVATKDGDESAVGRGSPWSRRRSGPAAILGAVVVLAVGGLAWSTLGGGGDERAAGSTSTTADPVATEPDASSTTNTTNTADEVASVRTVSARGFDLRDPTAVTASGDRLIVADGDRVVEIDGETVTVLLGSGVLDTPRVIDPELIRIADVAIDAEGSLIIADIGADLVKEITADGQIVELGSFQGPSSLALGPNGEIFVAESLGRRVSVIDSQGQVSTLIDGLSGPVGLVLIDGGLVIVERSADRIVRFALGENVDPGEREILLSVDPAEGAELAGVTAGPEGSILVADRGRHLVLSFQPGEEGDAMVVVGTGDPGRADDGGRAATSPLDGPVDVATAGGTSYVVDQGNDQIQRVGPDGILVTALGEITDG